MKINRFLIVGWVLSLPLWAAVDNENICARRVKLGQIYSLLKERDVRALVLDLDYTLASLRRPIGEEVVKQLFEINARGINICIITGAMEENVEWRVLSPIREYAARYGKKFDWSKFFLFTNTGSSGYRFDSSGNAVRFFHHTFTPGQSAEVKRAVESFRQKYGEDSITEEYVKEGKYTMYFKHTGKESISEYVEFFRKKLSWLGLNITAAGNRESIDITVCHKGIAITTLQKLLNLDSEKIMVVGDSFVDEFANDRHMVQGNVLVFNAGEPASRDLEGRIFDLEDYFPFLPPGPSRTSLLLKLFIETLEE